MKLPNPKDFQAGKSFTLHSISNINPKPITHDDKVLEQISKEIQNLDHTLETFKYQPYKDECLKIAPIWLFQEATSEALELFRHITVWDEKNQTIIFLVFDYKNRLISYKRRRFRNGKWVTCKGTHPNRQCIIRIQNNDLPVYIIEGHHDALSAILLDIDDINTFNFIAIPTVNYQKFNETELEVLKGKNVYFLPDLGDKDDRSIYCMNNLAKQIEKTAAHTRVVNIKLFLEENDIKVDKEKLDLSEALFLWNEGSSAFINALLYYCDRGIVFEGEIF